MRRQTVIRWISVVLLLATMATITAFSSQSAESSSDLSRGLAERLTSSSDGAADPAREKTVAEREAFLRGVAHFSLFLLLGIFASMVARAFESKRMLRAAIPFCWLYALLDETYQALLQRGRAFELADIAKDCGGALVGFCLVWLIVFFYKKRRTV